MTHTSIALAVTLGFFSLGFLTSAIIYQKRKTYWQQLGYNIGRETGIADTKSGFTAQLAAMTQTQEAYYDIKPEVDEIAMFLRERYKSEINLGYHANRKLGAIVTGYLAVERQGTQKLAQSATQNDLLRYAGEPFAADIRPKREKA